MLEHFKLGSYFSHDLLFDDFGGQSILEALLKFRPEADSLGCGFVEHGLSSLSLDAWVCEYFAFSLLLSRFCVHVPWGMFAFSIIEFYDV